MTPRRRAVFLLEEAWGVVLRKGTPVLTGVVLHDLQVLSVEERPEPDVWIRDPLPAQAVIRRRVT